MANGMVLDAKGREFKTTKTDILLKHFSKRSESHCGYGRAIEMQTVKSGEAIAF